METGHGTPPVSASTTTVDTHNANMRQYRVLIVEDNDFLRSTVAAALRAEHCLVVASVSSSKDAIQAASEHDIECAVIDLHLGHGPSGIDLAHALRASDPDLGIVLLTSYTDPRLHAKDPRALPDGSVYAIKSDIHSTSQLREKIDIAMGDGERAHMSSSWELPLTDNQVELLRMVAAGMTNAEIAKRRVVTERAVETTLARTVRKLGITPKDGENSRALLIQSYYELIGGSGGR
jgi:DNA-binding NarL/FixJ family response regulator